MAAVTATPESRSLGGAARHGVTNLAGVGVAAVLAFAVNVVVARGWSQADAGLFFSVVSVFMIAYSAARLGTGVGAVYFVSRYRALGQLHRIRPVLVGAALPVLAVGCLLAAAGWALAPRLAAEFEGAPADAEAMLRAVALFVPIAALGDTALAACRGFGRMGPLLLIDRLGRSVLQLLAVTLAAVTGASVTTALPLAWVGPYLPAGVVALLWLAGLVRRAERAAKEPSGPVSAELGAFWRFAGPRSASAIAQAAVQRLDIVLMATLRSTAEAAVYTAATRFMSLGQLSAQALSTAVQHRISERMARHDMAGVGRLYQAATGWVVLLAWPTYLLFAAYAEPLLALFGPEYAKGRSVTTILALTMLLATACGMVDTVLNMAGKTVWTFYNAMAAVVVNIALDLLLIPPFGIVGAAVAWSAAIVVGNVVPLVQLYWSMRLHPFGRGTLAAVGLATVCFAVPAGISRLAGGGLAVLVSLTVVGGLVYAAAVWRLRRLLELDGLRKARRAG